MSAFLKPLPVALDEQTKNKRRLAKLDSVPLGRMYQASFKAAVRLHLFFTGRTHELFGNFSDKAKAVILREAVDSMAGERVLDGTAGFKVQSSLLTLWGDTFKTWSDEFQAVRREAASIPFGVMAIFHERLVLPALKGKLEERVEDGAFSPQLEILLNSASEHLYGDSLNLSQRIWRIDRETRDGITSILLNGISSSDSAWNVALQLEQYLGANADCPRWTSTRLYGKTKSQIAAGDVGGLLSGKECDGRGVSYNALRLARTEIQKAHALATDKMLMSQPWVQKEQVRLSAAHPEHDICDDTVQGGEDGNGIYAVGTIELPLHPNCLCYKTAVLMGEREFTSKLRGWLDGTQEWSAMDEYADLVGGDVNKSILKDAVNLAVWLFDEDLEKWIQ
jgi:hypothetical protein